ncbi:MAG: hypothetical protein J5986_00710 [Roseburia sp.]|nr:hypothetical protein [Roseburia sp.]
MEELLELTKKQLLMQKIISACLAVMVVVLLIGGGILVGHMNRMAASMEDVAQKVEEIDMQSVNDAIEETQGLLESVDEFSMAVDGMTEKVNSLSDWFSGLLGGR